MEYTKQAKAFIEKTGIEIIKTFVGKKKYFPEDKETRNVYNIIIKRGDKHFSFDFGDSIANTQEFITKKPSDYSILCSLEKYEPADNIDDFASEFGIEKPSEAIRIYEAVKKGFREVADMFSVDEIELLQEIN